MERTGEDRDTYFLGILSCKQQKLTLEKKKKKKDIGQLRILRRLQKKIEAKLPEPKQNITTKHGKKSLKRKLRMPSSFKLGTKLDFFKYKHQNSSV